MQVLVFFPLMIEKQALENPVFCLHFPFSKHRTLVHMQLDLAAFLIVVQNQSAVPVADAAGSGAPAPAAAEDVMQMLFPWLVVRLSLLVLVVPPLLFLPELLLY
jgi:hypothetical protein